MDQGCVFCDIAQGRVAAYVVAESALAVAFLDVQPVAQGHCLVIPRRHVQWWDDLTEDETDGVFRLARLTAKKIRTAFDPEYVTMYVRGKRVPHAHLILVPTIRDDALDRVFNSLDGFQEGAVAFAALRSPQEMRSACEMLRNA